MNVYNGILRFRGQFRPYQQRVLDNAANYIGDGKLHIVAAPGSGKTTLGIELIRRIGKPALVISPRLVIRDQWLGRIEEAFLTDPKRRDILSADLRAPGLITSITYQTLFCTATRYKGVTGPEEDAGDESADLTAEEVDFSGLDLLAAVKQAGIGVICLDECHHLRSEWWKALEGLVAGLGDQAVVIALTATPPYDAFMTEWERYSSLCGPVDEEISVPELVAHDCLCPHQDYVLLSYPTEKERAAAAAYEASVRQAVRETAEDPRLAEAVAGHKGLRSYTDSRDRMLEDPAYLSSLLILLRSRGVEFDRRWTKLLGTEDLPALTEPWLERVLQGFLFDDKESFPAESDGFRTELEAALKRRGLITRGRVSLSVSDRVGKLLAGSLSKLDSIRQIAASEYGDMGTGLRMLILADYIRAEYLPAVGDPDRALDQMGVVPVFECLRRAMPASCRLGVLCGSVVLLPEEALPALCQAAERRLGSGDGVTGAPLLTPEGKSTGYLNVSVRARTGDIVALVTELFEAGQVEILVGTKALLGEGYDAPCVNSLILASFVGSYVLCNQMRGRAIRTQSGVPDKTANIWHLVCVDEPGKHADGAEAADLETLARRMEAFVGVSYDGKTIENGIERIQTLRPPYTEARIAAMNEQTLVLSRRRDALREQWRGAVSVDRTTEITEEYAAGTKFLRSRVRLTDVIGPLLLFLLGDIIILSLRGSALQLLGGHLSLTKWIAAAVLTFFTLKNGYELVGRLSPARYLTQVAEGVLKTLRELGDVASDCRVETSRWSTETSVALRGGTAREKELFAQCVEEFFAPVENQRYILRLPGGRTGLFRYFCVPARFAKRREDVDRFLKNIHGAVGKCEVIYTRNPEGRQALLRARTAAWANVSRDVSEAMAGKRRRRVREELI